LFLLEGWDWSQFGLLGIFIILHFLETKREIEYLKQHFVNKLELEAEAPTRLRQGLQEFKQQNKIHLYFENNTRAPHLEFSVTVFCCSAFDFTNCSGTFFALSEPDTMANIRSAAKRARQTEQRKLQNKSVLTGIKRQQKKLALALLSGDKAKARTELSAFSSTLDKAAKRGVVHKNLADRRKSQAAKVMAGVAAK